METAVAGEKLDHMMDELDPDEVLRHAEIEVGQSPDENENTP